MFLKISVRILAREASEVPLMTPPTTTTTTIAGWNILKVDQEALGNSYCSHIEVSLIISEAIMFLLLHQRGSL